MKDILVPIAEYFGSCEPEVIHTIQNDFNYNCKKYNISEEHAQVILQGLQLALNSNV